MRKFSNFMDLTGKNRELDCRYHGSTNINLEGRILREMKSGLVVGVSLWEQDVAAHRYDVQRRSLDVWYKQCPGVRIMLLAMYEFKVPEDIKEINVYDAGQKVTRIKNG
ncbi:hypothetical protein HY772_05990 [Candidatus Woesearchaeota archaeon]|nr:hypothetical protein [Candidatus Woesearchaeota archaeon]